MGTLTTSRAETCTCHGLTDGRGFEFLLGFMSCGLLAALTWSAWSVLARVVEAHL